MTDRNSVVKKELSADNSFLLFSFYFLFRFIFRRFRRRNRFARLDRRGLFPFEYLRTEENEIHCRKEYDEDTEGEKRLSGREGRKQHHREPEYDRGEILIHEVIRRGRFEIAVDLAKQYDPRARGTRQHAVHHQELLVFVFLEQDLRHEQVIRISNDEPDHAENEKYAPIIFDKIEPDRRNARHDHDIEEEIARTREQEIVGVLTFHDLLFIQEFQHDLDERSRQYADEEVESEDHRTHAGQELAESVHYEERKRVRRQNERDLYRQLVHAPVHGDLAIALYVCLRQLFVLQSRKLHFAFFLQIVQMDNAADTRAQEPERGDRQAEAPAADEAVIVFVDRAVIERLSRTLPVTEGQQHARRREEIGHDQRRDHRDPESEHRLQEIGRDGGNARIEDLLIAFFRQLLIRRFQRAGDKAERERVIGDDLHRRHAVPAEKRGVEQ